MNQPGYSIRSTNGYPDFFTDWTVRMPGSELKRRTHGTTFDTITRQRFKLIQSALPHVKLAKAFENTADALMAGAIGTRRAIHALTTLPDTPLPNLISCAVHLTGESHESHYPG
ncbi:MAG: hypothetical protein OXU40_04780 [Nitrospira sp.]|nr:hypothetical protein [Nitrospira sp.]